MNAPGRWLALAGLLVCSTLAGCAGSASRARGGQGRSALLTHEELARTNSDNLYDAIAKLRPEWLNSRGPTSVSDPSPTTVDVYMNGNFLGGADYLRQARVLDVSEIRYWDPGQAAARFGMGHPRGVIELIRE